MKRLLSVLRIIELGTTGKWILLSATIGIVAGLGAIFFQVSVQCIQRYALGGIAGVQVREAQGEHLLFGHAATEFAAWKMLAVLGVGGLLSGLLVYTLAPEAEGHGTDAAIDAFHNKRGIIRGRVPIVKTLASALTLGTGGSAGREGPIAQIGAGFGSFLANALGLSARDRRIMLAAGMGAGVGAIFRAPLAGALFAGEILYRDADLEADVIIPAAVASTVAYSVFCASLPYHLRFAPLFGRINQFDVVTPLELGPYTILSVVLALVGYLYIKGFYGTRTLFHRLPIPRHLKPACGALLAGGVGLGLYFLFQKNIDVLAVLGPGYGTLQRALDPTQDVTVSILLVVALCKIVTTSLTISSGGSGGVFGPSMVIGGCLGAAVGQVFHHWWPKLVAQPQAYAIVGMAGFFAGCARAPFSTIMMVAEMTGNYRLLLPTMWVSTLCFLLGHRWTLYEKQVPTRIQSPAHRGDFIIDILEGIPVRDVYQKDHRPRLVNQRTSLDDIVHMLAETNQRYFPVVDDDERLLGIFSADDVRTYMYDDTIWRIANARDVMTTNVVTVTPENDLNTALNYLTMLNVDELPVVDAHDRSRIIGLLGRKETIAAYHRRQLELKSAASDHS